MNTLPEAVCGPVLFLCADAQQLRQQLAGASLLGQARPVLRDDVSTDRKSVV